MLQGELFELSGCEVREVPAGFGPPGRRYVYVADAQGVVYSLRPGGLRRLKVASAGVGYLSVGSGVYVHRAVCAAFHGLPAPGQEVRHLNGVRTDNRACNLAWGSWCENLRDTFVHGTRRPQLGVWAARDPEFLRELLARRPDLRVIPEDSGAL